MEININRLTYCSLGIEITRRCNLKCAHCFRGEAQNIDMSKEVIDAFLEHTQAIYDLGITGGEPTIYLEGMRYFLESAKRHNVLIASMQFITNGTVRTNEVVDVVKGYYEYIKGFLIPEQQDKPFIRIFISKDDFHLTDYDEAYKWYCDNLSDYAFIGYNTGGQFPVKMGRANNIDYAINPDIERKTKIQIKTKDNKTFCKYKNQIPLFHPNQVIIMCGISVSTDGFLYNSTNREWDNEDNDNKISTVFVNSAQEIIDAIEKWNIGKHFCLEPEQTILKSNYPTPIFDFFDRYSTQLDNIKYSPSQEYKDEFFINQLVLLYNNYGIIGIVSAIIQGFVIGVDVKELTTNFLKNKLLKESEMTSTKNNISLKQAYTNKILQAIKDTSVTEAELLSMTQQAVDLYGVEKYGQYWEQIKELPLTDEEREIYYYHLQDLDCCKKLCQIAPENEKYKSNLSEKEKMIEEFKNSILNDKTRTPILSTELANKQLETIINNLTK